MLPGGFPFHQFCIPIYSKHVDYSTIRRKNDLKDTFRRNIIEKQPVFHTITNNIVFDSRKDVSACICKFTNGMNSVAEPLFSHVTVMKDESYLYQG